jgi:hypothetical protein
MSSWAHAAVASIATIPDPLAGMTALCPPVAAAAASLHRNAAAGSNSSGAPLLLLMTRDESVPIGIRELCSQQAAAHILQQITETAAHASAAHAWCLLQQLLPSPSDPAVVASMRTLHFATAVTAWASAVRLSSGSAPLSSPIQLFSDFDVERVMQAAAAGCEAEGRVAQGLTLIDAGLIMRAPAMMVLSTLASVALAVEAELCKAGLGLPAPH